MEKTNTVFISNKSTLGTNQIINKDSEPKFWRNTEEAIIKSSSSNANKMLFFESSNPNTRNLIIDKYKRIVLGMLIKDDIEVGQTSLTESYLSELLEKDISLTKEILNRIHHEHFDDVVLLQKLIEVMSNLDYEKLFPTNTILALGCVNHTNLGVQEAAIASYEKWDDKTNLKYLKNIKYTSSWIERYANEVIDYLESC